MPKIDLSDTLKTYGDADVTVSVESSIFDPVGLGNASPGATGTSYLNPVVPLISVVVISVTRNVPLYLVSVTLLMMTLVSVFRP